MHFQIVPLFHLQISIRIQITNAHDVFKGLRAHRASIHAQATADRARDSLHPLQPAEAGCLTGIGDLFYFRANTCSNFITVDFDLVEIASARMNHNTKNATVLYKQIGAATDDKKWKTFAPAKANQFRKCAFIAGLHPKLRWAAYAQGCVLRERLVEPDVALLANDRF